MIKKKMFKTQVISLVVLLVILVLGALVVIKPRPQQPTTTGVSDSNRQENLQALADAISAYKTATVGRYPWNDSNSSSPESSRDPSDRFSSNVSGLAWLNLLVTNEQLSSKIAQEIFQSNQLGSTYQIFRDQGDVAPVYVCFIPSEKRFQAAAAQACQMGTAPVIEGVRFCATTDGSVPTLDPEDYNLFCLAST